MRSAWRDRYGPPEVVEIREIERPTPLGDEVLVRVEAAAINRADLDDLYARYWFVRVFTGLRRPSLRTLGLDVAGVVEAVGPEVTRFGTGDRVFGDLYGFGHGAFADFACVPERALASIPDGIASEVAATLPHSAVLALQGLRWRDGSTIGPGDRVLVDGASGNVGPFAVQIAKARGAEVTATCSAAKMEFVAGLGADRVLDYRRTDYTAMGERFDWILDVDGHHPVTRARRALRTQGAYVTLGGSTARIVGSVTTGPVIGRATGKRMSLMTWWRPFAPDDVETLLGMISAGTLAAPIDRRYPLDELVAALRYVDEGRALGKVLVVP
jgi:NADPH:quinone reductase-like Zn-dependent oxidoreductase